MKTEDLAWSGAYETGLLDPVFSEYDWKVVRHRMVTYKSNEHGISMDNANHWV